MILSGEWTGGKEAMVVEWKIFVSIEQEIVLGYGEHTKD